jgi:DNA mismatch repair protein MSH6
LLGDHTNVAHKRRILDEDNDDCSDEAEFVPSSSDDDEESTNNEDDQWMVTDDEDEVAPMKKQKINSNLAIGTSDSKKQRKQKQIEKKINSAKSSLSQYAAPMILTQHSYSGNGKTTPSNIQSTLRTPQNITPSTCANGEVSAKRNSILCPHTVESSCKSDIATPLATSKSLLKPPKQNKMQQVPDFLVGALNPAGSHVHNHLPFLQNPRDSNGRESDDPKYDFRTLQINERDWIRVVGKKMTDAVKQWWDLKAMYFDTVLLFKTGML